MVGLGGLAALLLACPIEPVAATTAGYGSGPGPIPTTPYSGFNAALTRAPYATDLTQTSAQVTWATNPRILGSLTYGPSTNCTASTITVGDANVAPVRVSPNPTSTYAIRYDYRSSVQITGLAPSTTYCYEVFGADPAVDLLPASQPYQTFTTLDPESAMSTAPLTFDVVADIGETANRGNANDPSANNPSSVNSNQSAIMSLIGSSGARFVVGLGDIAYNDGSQANYGDLEQTGTSVGSPGLTEMSNIFGPSYWPLTGGMPMFAAIGNHGYNTNTGLVTWPESVSASEPGEQYGMLQYAGGIDGTSPSPAQGYPSGWYAFSSGNIRFYVIDASWNDGPQTGNFGNASGSQCPNTPGSPNCKGYQVDADVHFAPGTPEYTWLANDLAAHPGGIKFAFWHYPLRSDNYNTDSDVYLQQDLEPLLAQNGVNIVFNGHAHDYERNMPSTPNTVMSYVTGGGGGIINPVGGGPGCTPAWDAYAIGWAYSASNNAGAGSKCGSALVPTSDSQVFNFLRVTVQGIKVTVTPINATGQAFDERAYTFLPPVPSAPANVTAATSDESPSLMQLSWAPSTETGCWVNSYQINRNGSPIATVPAASTAYSDTMVQPGSADTYTVTATDACGTSSSPGSSDRVTAPLLATGFEAGTLSSWGPVTGGVTVQTGTVHAGTYAASVASSGGQSFAVQDLPSTSPVLYAQGWVNVASQSTSATLLGLRTQATQAALPYQVAQVYLLANGSVKVLNNVTRQSFVSTSSILPGAWRKVTFGVNETAGTLQVWLDGSRVSFNTPSGAITGQNLGTTPMGNVQIGDDATGRTYAWYADQVVVSQPWPTAVTGVVASATSPTSVRVNWSASSETGGSVAAYQVARNGSPIATVAAPTTTYADTTMSAGSTSVYAVSALDAGGLASQPGTSNQVTTPLFTTGFDSDVAGGLTSWTKAVNVSVQSQTFHTSPNAVSFSAAAGSQSFATQTLPLSSPALYAQAWVNISSVSPNTMTLMGVRGSAGQVARLFLQANGSIGVVNNLSRSSYPSNAAPSTGWHEITFAVDEQAGSMQAWLDGAPVVFNNTPSGSSPTVVRGQNLGTVPMSSLQLGDDSTQHSYSWYADDINVAAVQQPF